mgnify:CR=1 FL=1
MVKGWRELSLPNRSLPNYKTHAWSSCRLLLSSPTSIEAQFEERLLGLIEEVKQAKNIILFIDEIHTILRAGAVEGGALDAGNILKPALARGDLRVVGATTPEEYQRYIGQDAALEWRFPPV